MNYNEISIYTKTEGIDLLTSELEDMGITSFLIEDQSDFADFLEQNRDRWDMVDDDLLNLKDARTNVKIYIGDEDEGDILRRLEDLLMKLRMLTEIEGNETCRFSHPDVEGLLIDHAGNESCGHDKRYYNDYCDQYVFHADIILYLRRSRQQQKMEWFWANGIKMDLKRLTNGRK